LDFEKEEEFLQIYFESILMSTMHIWAVYGKSKSLESRLFSSSQRDTGIALEALSTIQLLVLNNILIVENLADAQVNQLMNARINYMEGVTLYKSAEVDKLLTGPVSLILPTSDTSAFDVFGRHWVFINEEWIVHANPSKASQRISSNNNFKGSRIGVDLLRNIFQTSIDILGKKLDMLKVINKIILNGNMFDQREELRTVDSFGLAVFRDMTEQGSPGLTSGLSGFRYEPLLRAEVTGLSVELSRVKTYWDKFSSAQNSKKAVFELINERVLDRLESSTEYGIEAFSSKAREIRKDTVLMQDAQEILHDKYGYGKNVDFTSIFDDVIKNIESYYGAIYDEHGKKSFGIVLRGIIGTYIKTEETFEQGDTEVIIFKITENEHGERSVKHTTKQLEYVIRNGARIFELKLSKGEIEAGWRIGVALQHGSTFEYYGQSLIALNGEKTFGRFDYDFTTNNIIDHTEQWYEDRTKWQYEELNGLKVGIRVLSMLSMTYGAHSSFVYSQTDISSQYLKHQIEYGWVETYFGDSSWIIPRGKAGELIRNILIKGINEAKKYFTKEEVLEAYLYLADYRNVYGQGKSVSAVRQKLSELLGKLNLQQDVLTGQIYHGQTDESLGTTKLEFEGILNTILKSKEDISTFFIENSDGSVNRDLTFKQWLDFVVNKIISSVPSTSKNPGALKILSWAQVELKKIKSLEMGDSKYFNSKGGNSELIRGKKMLEIVIGVIDHSTFRYTITHGISHNQATGSISTGVKDVIGKHQLADFCNQFSFYPSTIPTKGAGSYTISGSTVYDHKFSLFFSDSVIYFVTKNENSKDVRTSANAFYVMGVPVSFLEVGHRVSEGILSDLQSDFYTIYNTYKNAHIQSSVNTLAQAFLESDSFSVINDFIISLTETRLKNGEYISKAEQLHHARRAGLALRIGLSSSASAGSTRYYLEQAITTSSINLELNINGLIVNVPVSKFTNVPIYGSKGLTISPENQHLANIKAVRNRMDIIRGAITDNPGLNGKARFFITLDEDIGGIQYFKISKVDTLSKHFKFHGTGASNNPIYIDLDINNDPNNQLEILARLSMTYRRGNKLNRFGLVMKQQGASINSPAYFVLNGDSFLAEDEIFSLGGVTGGAARVYVPLSGLQFIGIFDINKHNEEIDKRYFNYYSLDYCYTG